MMISVFFSKYVLLLLTIAFSSDLKVATSCESGWPQYTSYCYFFADNQQSWDNAKQGCWNMNAMLVSVFSESEQSFIENAISNNINTGGYWMGLKGQGQTDIFTWIHGKEANKYTHFNSQDAIWEKSSNVCVYIDSNGFWRRSECSSTRKYICKTPDCPDGKRLNVNVKARGDCLIFQKNALSWQESRDQCQLINGDTDLASPTNNEFKNFIQNNYANQVEMQDFWLGVKYTPETLSLVSEQTTDWTSDDRDSSGGECIAWLGQQYYGERHGCTQLLKSLCQRSIYYYVGDQEVPTTMAPTTVAPTTVAPTTNAPTTNAPTTNAPTTNAPTTNAPTTNALTTNAPTTDTPSVAQSTKPTTSDLPTTKSPTTPETIASPITAAPSTAGTSSGKVTTDSQESIEANTSKSQTISSSDLESSTGTENELDDIINDLEESTNNTVRDTVLRTTKDWMLTHTTIPDDVDPEDYAQKYLSTCSDILDDENTAYWTANPVDASEVAEACSSVVDDLAKRSDVHVTISTPNLVATTKVYPQASSFEGVKVELTSSIQVVFTQEDFQKLGIADDKKVTISMTSYPKEQNSQTDLGGDPGYIVSGVVAITMFVDNVKISVPVRFTLAVDQERVMDAADGEEPICVYQKILTNGDTTWDNAGCQVMESTNTTVTCSCDHTTNFAILMQVTDVKISKKDELALNWITYVCCSLSIVALVMTLVVLVSLRSLLRSDRVTIHVNLVIALIWAQSLLLLATPAAASEVLCRAVAIMLHYFFLAVFCWMLVEGVHLYLQIVQVFSAGKDRLILYLLVGWGSPILIVAITAGVRWNEYGENGRCWLSTAYGMVWAFVGPALFIIAINFVILIMVLRILIVSAKSNSEGEYDHVKAGLKGAILLLPLLGITWLFGVISVSAHTVVFLYLFSIFNSLQGVFIFVLYIVFNGEVRNAIVRRKEKRALTRGDFTSTVDSTSDTKNKSKFNRVHPDSETKETQMVDIQSTTTTHTHTQMTFRKQPDGPNVPNKGGIM